MADKILIIDDSRVARRMLKTCIPENKGYEVFEAVDGRDGISKFKELRPDIIFMDLTMPVLDGYKAIEIIREIQEDAIIIVTTADIQPKSISSAMALGAFTVLKKPAKASSIQDAIAKAALKIEKLRENRTNDEAGVIFSEEEKDVLQEIMNIAFGNAAADLAEVVDIYVLLSVPSIHIVSIGALPAYLKETLNSEAPNDIVEQKFWGEFKGSGVLVFPAGAGRDLISVFEKMGAGDDKNAPEDIFEQGGMQELGNILIGACVGKVSELLDTFVTYSPPRFFQEDISDPNSLIEHFDPLQAAIVMKTVFTFQDRDISGFLLILTNHESIDWLRKALNKFLENYDSP